MKIKDLKLRKFRNYEELSLHLNDGYNVIFGENGQGKTNIIESIFLCASGRSHRTSKDAELINLEAKAYKVFMVYERDKRDYSLEIDYEKGEKKKIRLNEIPLKKLGEMIGQFNAVIFSPEDLMLIKEGPAERRRFIDITLSQLRPSYFFDLQQYAKILAQRNMLLKEIQNKNTLMDTLDVWDHNLVIAGARITKARNEFAGLLAEKARENHKKLTGGLEELGLSYTPNISSGDYNDLEKIKTSFKEKLNSSRNRELLKGTTLCGPQRDDYEFLLNGLELKLYGSQGQQRTAVLSLKLSEIDILKENTGSYPVLLLDDVMSELDNTRQEYLLSNLNNIQTFITCTDRSFFKRLEPSAHFFHVSSGTVKRVN